jgi:hypothetical protein
MRPASATRRSIAGTFTGTSTTVAGTAPELRPNRLMVTATASSKKFDVPISAQGAAMRWRTRTTSTISAAGVYPMRQTLVGVPRMPGWALQACGSLHRRWGAGLRHGPCDFAAGIRSSQALPA